MYVNMFNHLLRALTNHKQLQLIDVSLKPNGQKKALKETAVGASFVARSIRSNVPANCFLVIDTHSDSHSGGLQWGGGMTAPKAGPPSDVLSQFCGAKFFKAMESASNAARNVGPPQKQGWYEDSPFLRGGWRGLFVVSCAPVVRVRGAFCDMKKLVDE